MPQNIIERFINQTLERGVPAWRLWIALTDSDENNWRIAGRLGLPVFTVATLRRIAYSCPANLQTAVHLLLKTPGVREMMHTSRRSLPILKL